jgi:SAM-dependent methyltransferase
MNSTTRVVRSISTSERLPTPAAIVGCHLEQPVPGPSEGDLAVSGWAVMNSGPVDGVIAIATGRHLVHVRVDEERPDVAATYPQLEHAKTSGFRMLVPRTLLDATLEVVIAVSVAGAEPIPIWAIRFASEDPRSRALDDRLMGMERTVETLRSPIVRDSGEGGVLPPAGVIADFIDPDAPSDLRAQAARDDLPIPHLQNRERYRPDHAAYWRMGLADYQKTMAAARDLSIEGGRLYDFGGSTGRVFRHFHCQEDAFEVWASDFKLSTALWNQRHLPREIRCFLNTFAPPLPLPDRYFDVITAFSVFTHIDELEIPWLLELRRILRPGGLLYVTIHDEAFWERMPTHMLELLKRCAGGQALTADSPFPGPRSAFYFTETGYYSCNVFHSQDYIRAQWGRFFDTIELKSLHSEKQCVVLLSYEE